MDKIPDVEARAAAERRALKFGRHLLVSGPELYADITSLAAAAAAARQVDGLEADGPATAAGEAAAVKAA
jgi:hypothetical protein